MKVSITKRFEFEASHNLPYHKGKCHAKHGHSYKLDVTVEGDIITETNNSRCGMITDFADLKRVVDRVIIDKYDHTDLNVEFSNPTAENMVVQMFTNLKKNLYDGIKLVSVRLWETRTAYAECRE